MTSYNERSLQSVKSPAAMSVRKAALFAFAHEGYDGASVRQIARAAGVSISVLYHHYGNKQDLLYAILSQTTHDLSSALDEALRQVEDEPVARFAAAVCALADFYAARSLECRALNTEMRRLTAENLVQHLEERRRLQRQFNQFIDDGCRVDKFKVADPHLAGRLIVVVCRDIANWYEPDGAQTRSQITENYLRMALQLVEVTPAVRRRALAVVPTLDLASSPGLLDPHDEG